VSSAPSELPVYRTKIRDEWIDYNGHLSEAYYVLIFGFTSDRLMVHLGMDAEYRQRTGCSLYTVEAHIRYLLEVPAEAEVEVVPQIITAGDKSCT
jgi:acyl-CoA thioesterase FadM